MEIIDTQRLVLRRFRRDDAPDLFDYLHEPSSSCFFSIALGDMSAAQAEAEKRSASDEHIAVCLRESGKLIGDVFGVQEEDTFAVGWNFNPRFMGMGYAFEAATALFAHLFTAKNARRLYAYVEEANMSSRRLCQKLGMRQEGVFKEFISFTNDSHGAPIYEDTLQYALLYKEWRVGPLAQRVP